MPAQETSAATAEIIQPREIRRGLRNSNRDFAKLGAGPPKIRQSDRFLSAHHSPLPERSSSRSVPLTIPDFTKEG